MDRSLAKLTDDNDHAIKLPSVGSPLIWTDNDLKCVDPREQHQIQILCHILDHMMVMQQNAEHATRFLPMIASVSSTG